jgi:hypothetical protein
LKRQVDRGPFNPKERESILKEEADGLTCTPVMEVTGPPKRLGTRGSEVSASGQIKEDKLALILPRVTTMTYTKPRTGIGLTNSDGNHQNDTEEASEKD